MLPNLELLLVDDNSFSAPWKPIISPILSRTIRDKSSNPPTPKLGSGGNSLLTPQQRSLTTDGSPVASRPETPESMRRMKSTTDLSNYTPKAPDRLTSLHYGSNNTSSNTLSAPQNAADNQSTLNKKWGIFKKMSINRLRSASNVALRSTYSSHQTNPPSAAMSGSASTINVAALNRQSSPNPGSNESTTSKASKRRSFLPLNSANGLGLSTSPTADTFNENEEDERKQSDWLNSPSEGHDRREEEYARGFRFVMNYLRDVSMMPNTKTCTDWIISSLI